MSKFGLPALLAFLHRPGPLVPGLLTIGGALLFGKTCAAWQESLVCIAWNSGCYWLHDSQTVLSPRL